MGKPKFNCPFCDGTAPFQGEHKLYTIGDLLYWHEVGGLKMIPQIMFDFLQKYVEDGAKTKEQQHYQNVVNPPLITGPPEKPVLLLLNCPSLHILIGLKICFKVEFAD